MQMEYQAAHHTLATTGNEFFIPFSMASKTPISLPCAAILETENT